MVKSLTKIKEEIIRGIAIHLDVKRSEIVPKAHLVNDLGADSLDHIEICMAVEEIIERDIPDKEWNEVNTVNDIYKIAGC